MKKTITIVAAFAALTAGAIAAPIEVSVVTAEAVEEKSKTVNLKVTGMT